MKLTRLINFLKIVLFGLIALLLVSGCSAPQIRSSAAEAINATVGDEAEVSFHPQGYLIQPNGVLFNATLFVQGDDLQFEDVVCWDIDDHNEPQLRCPLGNISETTLVKVTGTEDSATLVFTRHGSSIPVHEIAR